jgi:multicomponent K+:H+ antiporter subunit A
MTLLSGVLVALRDPSLELIARPTLSELRAVDPVFALAWLLAAGCAVCAAYQAKYHRLVAVALAGAAGLISCVSFMWLSAPDLAVTQLLVEVVTTVLLLLGLRWLPKRIEELTPAGGHMRARARRGTDLMLALLGGTSLAAVAYAVMTHAPVGSISDYFLLNAYSGAGGRNVVNVLLVDFRGFDTLGEITVLGIVGLTVFALLRRFRPALDTLEAPAQQRKQNAYDERHTEREVGQTLQDYLLIPRVIIHWLFPAIVMLAIYFFLRGHDLPGGGFAAGVAMAIAFVLQYMAAGTRWVEARLRINPIAWMGIGLLIAALTGMGSWLFGRPFLTSWFAYAELPLLGKVPLATAVLFDVGVLALVVGATVLMLVALAHQSIRTPRAAATTRDPSRAVSAPPNPPAPSREVE